jgi:hypothetical protein
MDHTLIRHGSRRSGPHRLSSTGPHTSIAVNGSPKAASCPLAIRVKIRPPVPIATLSRLPGLAVGIEIRAAVVAVRRRWKRQAEQTADQRGEGSEERLRGGGRRRCAGLSHHRPWSDERYAEDQGAKPQG